MTDPGPPDRTEGPIEAPTQAVSVTARIRDHKVIQWGIAYLGAALAVAQAQQFLAAAFAWPDWAGRTLGIALIVGLPIALTVAWYHGHRRLQRISAGELWIISLLMLIGAVFFAAAVPGPDWGATRTIAENMYGDAVLEEPEFVAVRSRLGWR